MSHVSYECLDNVDVAIILFLRIHLTQMGKTNMGHMSNTIVCPVITTIMHVILYSRDFVLAWLDHVCFAKKGEGNKHKEFMQPQVLPWNSIKLL